MSEGSQVGGKWIAQMHERGQPWLDELAGGIYVSASNLGIGIFLM